MSEEIKKEVEMGTKDVDTVEETPVTETKNSNAELLAVIQKYGGDEDVVAKLIDLGVESVDDLAELTESDLTGAGIKLVKARKLRAELAKTIEEDATAATPPTMAPVMSTDLSGILPLPSTNESFLNALRTGGVLKIDDSTYEAGLRVFLADRCGLYSIPEKLSAEMESFADNSDEQAPPSFYALLENITRRDYSELFAAFEGVNGKFATKARRSEFLRRVRVEMCPAIRDAYIALDAWYNSMLATSGNPATLLQSITSLMSGAGMSMAASVPPTDSVHDAADTLKDQINHVFRGTSSPVCAAMAIDAMEIVKFLEDRSMPAMIGVANRDQMLKKLKVNVTPNYARLERNLVQFVLSYIKFDEAGSGNEVAYLTALWTLGRQIDWPALIDDAGSGGITGIGGSKHIL